MTSSKFHWGHGRQAVIKHVFTCLFSPHKNKLFFYTAKELVHYRDRIFVLYLFNGPICLESYVANYVYLVIIFRNTLSYPKGTTKIDNTTNC